MSQRSSQRLAIVEPVVPMNLHRNDKADETYLTSSGSRNLRSRKAKNDTKDDEDIATNGNNVTSAINVIVNKPNKDNINKDNVNKNKECKSIKKETIKVKSVSDLSNKTKLDNVNTIKQDNVRNVNIIINDVNTVLLPADDTENGVCECPICREHVTDEQKGLLCERCNTWHHITCLYITDDEYNIWSESDDDWFCDHCRAVRANNIRWGDMRGEDCIIAAVKEVYEEVIKWKKNIFLLPRGKAGTDFIKELSRLIYLFVDKTKWEGVALSLVHIFLPIMLQKPSQKSKARDHTKYLLCRLERWNKGDLHALLDECREIQRRLTKNSNMTQESNHKAFCRLMFLGKVGKAIKFINNDDSVVGVHSLTHEIKKLLEEKHPKMGNVMPEVLLPNTSTIPQPVIFENINADAIQKASMNLNGSGGPSRIDADAWRHILCSKSYGKTSYQLAEAMSAMARRLCCEEIRPEYLEEFISCRLIPLNKGDGKNSKPGIRPIGIGEVFRRIIGKAVVGLLKTDIEEAAGPLQTCAGLRSGIEAAIHASKKIWEQDTTEAIIQVDAENAFNRLNRTVALHNIQQICPPLHRYLCNHYQQPAKLIITDDTKQDYIFSEEGTTQGDVASMAKYALGIKPLVDKLSNAVDPNICKQAWYADDSSAGGKLQELKKWWDVLCLEGPKYGYYPKASKCNIILKDKALMAQAEDMFASSGIQIEYEGQRHLGAVIGSDTFRKKYVTEKVMKWIQDIEDLSKIAIEEPQAALSAFTKGICHRWAFIQRTIPDVKELFIPLENSIHECLIPALIGRKVSSLERNILALPVRYGGLGLANPVKSADREYKASCSVTENLAQLIFDQERNLSNYNRKSQSDTVANLKEAKETYLLSRYNDILQEVEGTPLKRSLQLNREKGAGSWLTTLPLKSYGYSLNKLEFRDSICLRYGWRIPNTPQYCGCGTKNTVDHTLICKKGGYVAMRHNNIRDINAELQKEVCRDVVVEPQLIPLDGEETSGTQADRAAPDISSRGMWSTFERTFYDVRVLRPNSPSYQTKTLKQLYSNHEKEKMRKYNNRILQVEKGSFTPLIYTTYGGWGPQATKYHKRLAELLSKKRNEEYASTMNYIRTRIRFSLLRSVLVAVRGERGKKTASTIPIAATSFNLIPETMEYESF